MKKLFFLLLLMTFLGQNSFSQRNFTISGTIRDATDGESLIGVNIYAQEEKTGASTNVYGFYSLTLPEGEHTLIISYVGYEKITEKINLKSNLTKIFELEESGEVLEEVIISAEREDHNVRSLEVSVNKVEMKTIKKMPALLGEVDLIRSIQFLPGVSSVGEGSTGFNVRGGAIDQNLVLLDEAPVYNSSHLMGFFSIFNPDVVKDVKLIKGGVPSMYGGRVSSILDVRMKEGNTKKTSVSGGIGTIFTRLMVETPIKKDKGAFVAALRRSYIDILAKPFLNKDFREVRFYFYDFTAKAHYQINDKNTIFLSGYFGRDVFGADFGFDWGNATTTFRWNKVINNKLFLNTTGFYSDYSYSIDSDLKGEETSDVFKWDSRILNYSLKPDFTWYPNAKNTVNFGGQTILYNFKPGDAFFSSGGQGQNIGLEDKMALESSVYIGNEQKINTILTFNYGLRYSLYDYFGVRESYLFDESGTPGERKPLLETQSHKPGDIVQQYGNLEPRFSANLSLGANSSLKLGYNRLAQYLHLLSNTAAASPLDLWMPSTNNIKPQLSDQIALGYFRNFGGNAYETSVEIYYKTLQNQIDYTRNASLFLNPLVEGDLLYGDGRAYGAEFFIKKNKGKFTGWVSYTLARTERKVNGINNNNRFPARIDKLHNLSTVAMYELAKRWELGGTFTYMTGTPATFPTSKYIWQGIAIPHNYYDERNAYRIPPSHRLDLSVTRKNKSALFGKGESEWVFSVYNVYNRRNPFTVYVRPNAEDPSKTEAVRYSVFASVLPALTYNFKF